MKTRAPRAAASQPARHDTRDTRAAILQAATAAFAARGFDGASVDRIAEQAGVNKAMIYYHFSNKQALYLEILRDIFASVGAGAREIAATSLTPEEKIDRFVEVLWREAQARPQFPPMMLREIAEGGRHLDRATLTAIGSIFSAVVAIIEEGQQAGRFVTLEPHLTYFSLIAPIVFYLASAPVRASLGRLDVVKATDFSSAAFLAHVQFVARRMLLVDAPLPRGRKGRPSSGGTA